MERGAQRAPGDVLQPLGWRPQADRFRAQLRRDLGEVLQLLRQGAIDAQIARRSPLRDAGQALRYAEQGSIVGKVILEP